MIKNPV